MTNETLATIISILSSTLVILTIKSFILREPRKSKRMSTERAWYKRRGNFPRYVDSCKFSGSGDTVFVEWRASTNFSRTLFPPDRKDFRDITSWIDALEAGLQDLCKPQQSEEVPIVEPPAQPYRTADAVASVERMKLKLAEQRAQIAELRQKLVDLGVSP